MSDEQTTCNFVPAASKQAAREHILPALVIAWSQCEPARIGEVALITSEHQPWLLGRGAARDDDPAERVRFVRQRPGSIEFGGPLQGSGISRQQLLLRAKGAELQLQRTGRCPVLVNGCAVDETTVKPGDTILLAGELLLLCVARPARLRAQGHPEEVPFGAPDRAGMVGESPALWELRERIAFFASSQRHALLLGETGTGKELAARAIHQRSSRALRPLVSRNAATIPRELIDAELFGNARNYPNPGMAERPGLIGEADGSALFLDEIGEIPPDMQAHLLRVLDGGGEYQRLGEAKARRVDLRLIGATNRSPDDLKGDFAARLTLRLRLPTLNERREDIPLLLRHLLRCEAQVQPELLRFFPRGDVQAEPRLEAELVDRLLRHEYAQHLRELLRLLLCAVADSEGDCVSLSGRLEETLQLPEAASPAPLPPREIVEECLRRHGGNLSRAWPELGLKNRYVLRRLLRKYGLARE